MRIVSLTLPLFFVGLSAGEPKHDVSVAKELKKFEGKWVIDAAYLQGKEIQQHKGAELVFKDAMCMSTQNGQTESFEITIDPSKKVKEITSRENGKTILGIYELDGDSLRICFGEKRPGKVNKNDLLYILKRSK